MSGALKYYFLKGQSLSFTLCTQSDRQMLTIQHAAMSSHTLCEADRSRSLACLALDVMVSERVLV